MTTTNTAFARAHLWYFDANRVSRSGGSSYIGAMRMSLSRAQSIGYFMSMSGNWSIVDQYCFEMWGSFVNGCVDYGVSAVSR